MSNGQRATRDEQRALPVPALTVATPTHAEARSVSSMLSAQCALFLCVLAYITVIFAVSKWELDTLRMGFDPLVYEQPLWNTLHGHLAEQSSLAYTHSAFGQDLFLFHFVLLPFYALKPTTATLLFLQTVAAGAGAIAIFLIAWDAFRSRPWPALLFAVAYLGYLPLQNVNLYEVQPRLFAVTFLLFAYWCMRRGYTVAFWVLLALALTNRNDTSLVVAALGLYGVLTRRRWVFGWLPLAVGALYWLLAVFVLVPAIAGGAEFSYLQNYDWLGTGAGAIMQTIVTHPWYVLHTLLDADRWHYAFQLLYPLAFLPLLHPRVLLMAAPPFLLNIFAGPKYAYQRDIYHQYPALIVPWLFVAAILAAAALADGTHPLLRLFLPPLHRRHDLHIPHMDGRWRGAGAEARATVRQCAPIALILLLILAQQATTERNRVGSFVTHRHDATTDKRIASLDILIPMIPNDAPLAVTNHAALRVPVRRYLYMFPGDKFYDPALVDKADYLLGDHGQTDEDRLIAHMKANGQWQIVKRQGDFELLHRIAPPPGRTP